MFEPHTRPPLTQRAFLKRMIRHGGYGLWLLSGSLCLGIAGYHWIARFSWVDSFLNASMLLGGMGPVGDLPTQSAKIFAGVFALYSGMVFLVITALILTPLFHRVLHKFHFEMKDSR